MKISEVRNNLMQKGLRVTPQRVAILEAIIKLGHHPSADKIIGFIKKHHPNIATGTVYKVLDALFENNLVKKVKTEKDIMRYDAVREEHHHLYSTETERIEDYINHDLNKLLTGFFSKNKIDDFEVDDIKVQIIGRFKNK